MTCRSAPIPATLVAAILATGLAPLPASAAGFTTAAEVRPILTATKANWVAVREYDGKDLLYFTQIESWRCGLSEVRYGLNGNPADQIRIMEPCYEDEAAPNAIKAEDHLPYITLPPGSVNSITIELVYDDATTDTETFTREAVQIP